MGNVIPTAPTNTASLVYRWWEKTHGGTGFRAHLGASLIGRPCDRELWYSFRWCVPASFSGRMLRLFDRGKREEAIIAMELRGIGCEVWGDGDEGQFTVSYHGGHFGGSADLVVKGLPEAPKTPHLVECKTWADKGYQKLKKEGVAQAKQEHEAQCQIYMDGLKIDRAIYYPVNKNDDDLTAIERVHYEPAAALKLLARAERIIFAPEPPPKLSEDPSFWQCRYCDKVDFCSGVAPYAAVNCRTCLHSTPEREGEQRWSCAAWPADEIPLDAQRTGCPRHAFLPALLSAWADPVDSTDSGVVYRLRYVVEGQEATFENGPAGIPSVEMVKCADPGLLPGVGGCLDAFAGAEVEG